MPILRLLAVSLLLLLASRPADAAPSLALLQAHFECLWWSPEQFAGFDPNHPPEKRTVTVLTKWEYSDPVSVPHPDVLTLVATLAPGTAVPAARIRWLTRAGWVEPRTPAPRAMRSGTGQPATYRFEIPVEAAVDRYRPARLRVILSAGAQRLGQADLPFQLGD